MKRLLLTGIAAALLGAAAFAQHWRAMGKGVNSPSGVQTLYGDSVSDRLLAGGTFKWIYNETDTVLGIGQAAWDGNRWDSLAHRIQPGGFNSAQQTYWFLRFQGHLYACGGYGFETPEGEGNRSLARLNEITDTWEALECTNPVIGGMETLVPKEPQETMYATGHTGSLCGYPESCVFRYDGNAFHIWEPFELIPEGNNAYVGTVFDFKGKTYMTCALPDPVDGSGFVSFIRWNGSSWEHVPGWNTLSPIKDISIRNDTLYVAGTFTLADGGPGNLVAAFDGEEWSDMGGGLLYPPAPMSGAALDLEWFRGELMVCGRFTVAGGIPCTGIAKWNGHQWCTLPGAILHWSGMDARVGDMAVWRDSLYICGGFTTIDGDSIRQVAQWIGGDAVEACSTVGVDEVETTGPGQGLLVLPTADDAVWSIHFPHAGKWTVEVYDATGRHVRSQRAQGAAMGMDLSTQAPGMYLLRARDERGTIRGSKVIRP